MLRLLDPDLLEGFPDNFNPSYVCDGVFGVGYGSDVKASDVGPPSCIRLSSSNF